MGQKEVVKITSVISTSVITSVIITSVMLGAGATRKEERRVQEPPSEGTWWGPHSGCWKAGVPWSADGAH